MSAGPATIFPITRRDERRNRHEEDPPMTQVLSILRTHDDREIPAAGEYTVDPAHTSVEFIGRHLMITKVRGRFPEVSGTITIADEPERSHVEVELGVATLETGNPDRDGHLRSADFFDA